MATAPPVASEWITDDDVRQLSSELHDPADFAIRRRAGYDAFRSLALEPNPLYRKYGYFSGVDLGTIDPLVRTGPVELPAAPEATIRIVHDGSGTRIELPEAARSAGVTVEPLATLWAGSAEPRAAFLRNLDEPPDRLSALGFALVNRGFRLTVPARLSAPVRLQDLTVLSADHQALSVRRAIDVGAGSRLLASEETYTTGRTNDQRLVASSTDLAVGADAQAAYLTVHAPDTGTVGLCHRTATVGQGGRLGWVWTGFGGFRTKVRNHSVLVGNGSDFEDLQTFFGAGSQAYDSGIQITHQGTDTHGQSITRGVFQDDARGMSRGLVRIEKEARKTVSFLSEHAMLLSRGARSDSIPILEILCRDVKATHSSSVAPVDPEKVFYLESRGMPRANAVRMISDGFLGHVLGRAPVAHLRELLYPLLETRWAGTEVRWSPEAYPSLGRLEFAADVPPTDWRFDAKLR